MYRVFIPHCEIASRVDEHRHQQITVLFAFIIKRVFNSKTICRQFSLFVDRDNINIKIVYSAFFYRYIASIHGINLKCMRCVTCSPILVSFDDDIDDHFALIRSTIIIQCYAYH